MYAALLGESGPRTMAGYRRLRDVADEDRALPAWSPACRRWSR